MREAVVIGKRQLLNY